MGKYDGLRAYLHARQGEQVRMTFDEVAAVVAGGLPPSAYRYREWWSNETSGSHVQARAWIHPGWHVTTVNLAKATVVFERTAHL